MEDQPLLSRTLLAIADDNPGLKKSQPSFLRAPSFLRQCKITAKITAGQRLIIIMICNLDHDPDDSAKAGVQAMSCVLVEQLAVG